MIAELRLVAFLILRTCVGQQVGILGLGCTGTESVMHHLEQLQDFLWYCHFTPTDEEVGVGCIVGAGNHSEENWGRQQAGCKHEGSRLAAFSTAMVHEMLSVTRR